MVGMWIARLTSNALLVQRARLPNIHLNIFYIICQRIQAYNTFSPVIRSDCAPLYGFILAYIDLRSNGL